MTLHNLLQAFGAVFVQQIVDYNLNKHLSTIILTQMTIMNVYNGHLVHRCFRLLTVMSSSTEIFLK